MILRGLQGTAGRERADDQRLQSLGGLPVGVRQARVAARVVDVGRRRLRNVVRLGCTPGCTRGRSRSRRRTVGDELFDRRLGRDARVRFWELASVCRAQPELVARTAAEHSSWSQFEIWYHSRNELLASQDREKLDSELPEEFVKAVLECCSKAFFLGGDARLRSYPLNPDDEQLSALEAYSRFGNVLEEALEFGSVRVHHSPGRT